nr:pentapeptide repeat-containing protein [Desulforadius tongensis]
MYISGVTAVNAFNNAGAFNAWRNKPVVLNEGKELKLPHISLEFNDCDLSGQNLSGYNLSTARFKNVNLQGADLKRANLSGAFFENVNFEKADMSGAELSGYNRFINCSFINANVAGTAMAELLNAAIADPSSRFKFVKCQLLPGVEVSACRQGEKNVGLDKQVKKITAALKAVDEKGIFTVLARLLPCDQCFHTPDPHTKFLEQLKRTYPAWEGWREIEELVAEISAALVLEQLRF